MSKETMSRSERRARARRSRRVSRCLNLLALLIILALCAYIGVMMLYGSTDPVISFFTGATPVPAATPTPAPTPVATPVPVATPQALVQPEVEVEEEPPVEIEPVVTPEPTPEPTPVPVGVQEIDAEAINEKVSPDRLNLMLEQRVYSDGTETNAYTRETPVSMNQAQLYSGVDGITTFRGNHYRNSASVGTLAAAPSQLTKLYSVSGKMGWIGQPLVIRWDDETRLSMNLYDEKKAKSGLVEVVCGTLNGDILFFDLEDGTATRDPIHTGIAIKGTPALDPRGYPILYCAQSADNATSDAGMLIYSLIDGTQLASISHSDVRATVDWRSCDGSPLVDAETDTLFWAGENGLVYSVSLNTAYDPAANTVSVDPVVDQYRGLNQNTIFMGYESSMAIYNHYAYITDNFGLITCLDLNTMKAVWVVSAGDDTDATVVLEEDDSGVYLYTGNVYSNTNKARTIVRKLDALTGKSVWAFDTNITAIGTGGMFATPALGSEGLSDLVYFTVAYTADNLGTIYAVDKNTGEEVWKKGLNSYTWSSPVLVYDESGNGYVLQCLANGRVVLMDGRTGEQLATLDLEGTIEASPAVYGDTMIIGTSTGNIYAVKLN